MAYRYIDRAGREIEVESATELTEAMDRGALPPDTRIFDSGRDRWIEARTHPALADAVPAVALRGSGKGLMRSAQVGALFVVTLLASVITSRQGLGDPYSAFGSWAGTIGATFLFSALFLGWSRRTRSYIPFGMIAVALMSGLGDPDRLSENSAQVDTQLAELEGVLDRVEREWSIRQPTESWQGAARTTSPIGSAPPTGSADARAVWAAARGLEAMEEIVRSYEVAHDVRDSPIGWMELEYFANASDFPQVGRFLERHRAFIQDLEVAYETEVIARMGEILDQAGLAPDARVHFERSFLASLRESSIRASGMADRLRGFTATASELHWTLVANADVIHADPASGQIIVRDEAVEFQIWSLLDELDWYHDEIGRVQNEIMAKTRGLLEEGRTAIQ